MLLNSKSDSPRPIIIPIGGFLGAGKTNLILAAARILQGRGIKSAAILNDQGSELADTRWVRSRGVQVDEVLGGCFCCLFSEMVDAAERLRARSAEVIFAEAVGSCTDISATTLQPLKLYHKDSFRLAPYTVLVDPARAEQMSGTDPNTDFAFLFEKQVEEADLICFTKSDLFAGFRPRQMIAPVRFLSSVTGHGVEAWLDEVLAGTSSSGTKLLDIDYQHYARAEARLAWLNCRTSLTLESPISPPVLIGPLLDDLGASLTEGRLQIAHLKIVDDTASGFLKASIIRNGDDPALQGDLAASPELVHDLLLNIRAAGEPTVLQSLVERHLFNLPGKLEIRSMQCFRPSPPAPEYRMREVASVV
jgi:CobW/HypB/UreG, nucleotide-binding domain